MAGNKVKTQGEVKVTVAIRFVPAATTTQSAAYRRFWTNVISTVNDDVKGKQPQSQKPEDKGVTDESS